MICDQTVHPKLLKKIYMIDMIKKSYIKDVFLMGMDHGSFWMRVKFADLLKLT